MGKRTLETCQGRKKQAVAERGFVTVHTCRLLYDVQEDLVNFPERCKGGGLHELSRRVMCWYRQGTSNLVLYKYVLYRHLIIITAFNTLMTIFLKVFDEET